MQLALTAQFVGRRAAIYSRITPAFSAPPPQVWAVWRP